MAATATAEKRKPKKAKPAAGDKKSKAAAWTIASYVEARSVEQIPTAECYRHDQNRQPADADVARVAESIAQVGQLDPIVVRRRPHDSLNGYRYQILSGETRYRAKRQLGHVLIDARIVDVDDTTALVIVAAGNAARKDLNTIQRAQLAEQLTSPADEGGAELTRDQAAELLGLESAASVSNLLKLLEAPAEWQRGLVSGWAVEADEDEGSDPIKLHEGTVREAAKWTHVPNFLEEVREAIVEFREYTRHGQLQRFEYNQDDCGSIRLFSGDRYYGYENGGKHPCYLDPQDAALAARLGVIDTPAGPAATNVALFDELQLAEVRKRAKSGAKKSLTEVKKEAAAEGRALTPKELARLEAEKRKTQDAQLENWAKEWRLSALRIRMAQLVDDSTALAMLPALLLEARESEPLQCALMAVVNPGLRRDRWRVSVNELLRESSDLERTEAWYIAVRLLLWPVWSVAAPGMMTKPHEFKGDFEDENPGHLPPLPWAQVRAWAEWLGATFAEVWKRAAYPGDPLRQHVERLLTRHTTAQLRDLAAELDLELDPDATKASAVEFILANHVHDAALKIPAIVGGSEKTSRKRK